MDVFGFARALAEGRVAPVYLFVGPEALLIREALDQLTRTILPDPGLSDLNRQLFRGGDDSAEVIVEALGGLPFLAERRLVIVRNVEKLPAKDADRLAEYIKRPNPSSCLALVAETADMRRPLFRAVPESALVEARPLGARTLPVWLRQRARAAGAELTPEAATLLVELAGEETAVLAGELEKAMLYAGEGPVGVEEVRAVLGVERIRSIFELTNALVRRDVGAAVSMVGKLLTVGEEPLGLLGMVTRELRFIWQVKRWTEDGKSAEEIARLARRPAAVMEATLARAQATPAGELRRGLHRCWQVEARLKSGTPSPRMELERLLYEVCRS